MSRHAYGPAARQELELYRPPTAAPWPVLVFFHGGGWVSGELEEYQQLGTALAAGGFLTAVVTYRLAPSHPHPAQIADAARAVGWLWQQAAAEGGDPTRLLLCGHSAGAQLATLLAADAAWLAPYGVPRPALRGVVGISGVYHLPWAARVAWMCRIWIRPCFGHRQEAWEAASPTLQVVAGEPPHWLHNAARDWGLHRHSRELASRLAEQGTAVWHTVSGDGNHVSVIQAVGAPGDATTRRWLSFAHWAVGERHTPWDPGEL
ncbi:MAG: alpha/beta hydrolase [Fimbriimonadaceae bacterium]|nr:alpha/beta hydrolase [Fimbriimonadaceae bacterium]